MYSKEKRSYQISNIFMKALLEGKIRQTLKGFRSRCMAGLEYYSTVTFSETRQGMVYHQSAQ